MSNGDINVTQNVGEVKDGGTVIGVQVIYQGEPVLIPSPEVIRLHRLALVEKEEYHRWADEFYIQEEGKILPIYASPYEDDTGRQREDLLQSIRAHQRLLVLGEPGMGKTVAMERIVWETAQAEEIVVPIFVPLLYFQKPDLLEMVRVALHETGRLTFENTKSVRAFLRTMECLFLFDGLNEVPGQQRGQVIGAIASFMREFPEHRYVVTSRLQDELWRKLRSSDLIQDAVVVQNISDSQVQSYLQAHLGEKAGQALYNQLDTSLKALARTPLLLKLIRDAGQGSDQLPRNRGELFDQYVMNKLLEREQKLELKETPEVIKKALSHLAFALQLDHRLACEREWAEKILAEDGLTANASAILSEVLVHGLLQQQNIPGKRLLRFMHQAVQEYFVALILYSEVDIEKNASFIHNLLRKLSQNSLVVWAKDAWWSECFVQLAGLVDDADWLANRIVNINPWLAWWCVEEGRQVHETTRSMIETRSIKLLHSERIADRRRAVQTLARIRNERTLEHLLFAAGDTDREVFGLALRSLLDAGADARTLIKNALDGADKRSWLACFRYLGIQTNDPLCDEIPSKVWEALLGQPMVWVPPGLFLMGSDKSKDLEASDDELPQHSIALPGFWIGRLPVTITHWRLFVEESGYGWGRDSLKNPVNYPMEYVNWQDAMAYCNWLSKKSGLLVALPSEAEWEKAARGEDGRIYPWGNGFEKNRCNTCESGIDKTTPVGKYSPLGDSPYGCSDMAGNLWEWTCSKFKPYPYKADDGRENLSENDFRVLRGGSWRKVHTCARTSYRNSSPPHLRTDSRGFRIVVHPPSL